MELIELIDREVFSYFTNTVRINLPFNKKMTEFNSCLLKHSLVLHEAAYGRYAYERAGKIVIVKPMESYLSTECFVVNNILR